MAHAIDTAAGERAAQGLLAKGLATIELGPRHWSNVTDVYRTARRFFAEPEDRRLAAALPFGCGYVPFGREHSGDPDRPDQVDCFSASPRMQTSIDGLASGEVRLLYAAMMRVFQDLEALAEAIAGSVAEEVAGRQSVGSLHGGLHRWSRLEVHQARRLEPGALINEPHEDGHLLTFAHADAPGLETEVDGSFRPAERPASHLIVMPGSTMTLLTGGAIPPLRHQVRSHGGTVLRLSMLFFADLDPGLCAPWRVTAINRDVDIGAHVAGISRRFGTDGFERD